MVFVKNTKDIEKNVYESVQINTLRALEGNLTKKEMVKLSNKDITMIGDCHYLMKNYVKQKLMKTHRNLLNKECDEELQSTDVSTMGGLDSSKASSDCKGSIPVEELMQCWFAKLQEEAWEDQQRKVKQPYQTASKKYKQISHAKYTPRVELTEADMRNYKKSEAKNNDIQKSEKIQKSKNDVLMEEFLRNLGNN